MPYGDDVDDLLTPQAAAAWLGISRDQLNHFVRTGLPMLRLSWKVRRFSRQDVIAWAKKYRQGAVAPTALPVYPNPLHDDPRPVPVPADLPGPFHVR